MIYDYALPDTTLPFPKHKCRKRGTWSELSAPEHLTAIMRTNKQVFCETSARLYSTKPFIVEHRQILNRVLENNELFKRMRHLVLLLSHDEFLALFGSNSRAVRRLEALQLRS